MSLLSPQFIFNLGFICSISYAFRFITKWNLILSKETLKVLLIGFITFFVVSIVSSTFLNAIRRNEGLHLLDEAVALEALSIERWKFICLVCLQILCLVLTLFFLISHFGTNLSAAIFSYRNLSSNGNLDYELPSFLKLVRRVALASGYIVVYLFLVGLINKDKKNRLLQLVCILLSIINGFLLGGRGDGLQIIIAALVQFIALNSLVNTKNKINLGVFFKVFLIVFLIFISFVQLGELLGRQMEFLQFDDYMGVYLSAELKNLDTFVLSGSAGHPLSQSLTLYLLINTLGKLFVQPNWIHSFDIPFRYFGNYALGNVGTIFYPFYYDFRIPGIIFYTSIMAFICQYWYQSFLKGYNTRISLALISYSYLAYVIAFSFFSNKFYEMIFNTSFLWYVFSWILIKYFLLNVRVKI